MSGLVRFLNNVKLKYSLFTILRDNNFEAT